MQRWPGREIGAVDRAFDRILQVGVSKHDEGILAAHFELEPAHGLGAGGRDLGASGDRAREGDRVDLLVVENRLADDGTAPDDQIEHALGNAGAHDDFRQRVSAAGNKVGRLENHRVAIGQRRRDLPGGNREWKVPRGDDADDPERLAGHLDVDIRPHAAELLSRNPQHFASEEVEDLSGSGRLADTLRQRLAFLARQQASELFAAGENFSRDAQQNVMPLLRRRPRPSGKRSVRGLDRSVRLCGVGLRVFADKVVCVRRVDVASDARAVDPFSGDKVLVRAHAQFLNCRPNFCCVGA